MSCYKKRRCRSSFARSTRANVFAARKVHWTLRLSGSALRIAFSRYALSEKAGRRALVVTTQAHPPRAAHH
ncbi:hypothetical protein CJI56_05825 [Gardnerella vaginalis]|nr:hypothetical protein CYJ58_02710 [Gardnerella vaginalis]TCH81616.1 hypothetical protein E0E46_06325 [Gardnerella vaginalis ATCC 14018 = JCM 11026]PMC49894.1 hypothetical protein CJ212_03840 [Gardnerella vaginalis]RFT31423.1 hypothetical protein CG403_04320 [Gardnerella vaginalis]RIY19459.1 hypothetical protein CJI56_05825 [Gardnerella vaginalis]